MRPVEKLLDRLDRVKVHGPRWRAVCPAHESKHKTLSLSISEMDDGRVLMKCFAGCAVTDIVSAIGLSIGDLFEKRITTYEQQSLPPINRSFISKLERMLRDETQRRDRLIQENWELVEENVKLRHLLGKR